MISSKKARPGGPAKTGRAKAGAAAPASDCPEGAFLAAWWPANASAPSDWRVLAKHLSEDQGMRTAWAALRKHGDVAKPVFSDVRSAFLAANREVMREPATIERRKLQLVSRLARELKTAIEQSPLPRNTTSRYLDLQSRDLPPVEVRLGWRDLQAEVHDHFGYSVAIVDFLQTVGEMVNTFEESLPARAVARHRVDPLMSAFVRHLAWLFVKRFGREYQGTVAAIANAVLHPAEPMTKQSVQAILKDSPAPFRPQRKRHQPVA